MRFPGKTSNTWKACGGVALAVGGMELIAFADVAPRAWLTSGLYGGGFLALVIGLFLIWDIRKETEIYYRQRLKKVEGNFLGRFKLNRYLFEAYERKGALGNQEFRLLATPAMSAEQEAACIRYLVNEGLIEELWPQMSQKITKESEWAFFG